MNGLEMIFWLVFAHIIGDMSLQTEFIAMNKGKKWYLMFCHIMIYTGVIGIALLLLNIFNWWGVLWIAVSHYAMDKWKSLQPRDEAHFWQIYLDQGWHYLQLIIMVVIVQWR